MKEIINAQRNFFNTHATKDIQFRRTQLKKLQQALEQNEALLHEAIYKDFKNLNLIITVLSFPCFIKI